MLSEYVDDVDDDDDDEEEDDDDADDKDADDNDDGKCDDDAIDDDHVDALNDVCSVEEEDGVDIFLFIPSGVSVVFPVVVPALDPRFS